MSYPIESLLTKAVELKASDIHLTVGEVPAFRINGTITKFKFPELKYEDVNSVIEKITPQSIKETVEKSKDIDFSFEIKNVARFRVNIALTLGKYAITIRIIPSNIKTFSELGLPSKVEDFAKMENGLVLVTGITGSGKSTTIASILEYINSNRSKHIITIEDPIEFVFNGKKSIFTQRQIGSDTEDFHFGLKYAMRQDPDVIFIGEIRDVETVKSALHAAETGHLVFSTLHTIDAVQTFHRILGFFPPHDREAVKSQFAEVFRGSISQRLLPNITNTERVAAVEILISTPTIKDFFKKDKLEEIYDLVNNGAYDGMVTFNMSLQKLYKEEKISMETALKFSDNPNELSKMIRGAFSKGENQYNVI